MNKATVRDIDVRGKRALVRVDFNVPLDATARSPTTRASAPRCRRSSTCSTTARAVILMSHLGRPKGKRGPEVQRSTPVAARLSELLGKPVPLAPDCVGPEVEAMRAERCQPGEVLLLENLRFHPEEEANDPAFARQLAALATSMSTTPSARRTARTPRPRASPTVCPAVAGFLMEKELSTWAARWSNPKRPFVAISRRREGLGQDRRARPSASTSPIRS